MPILRRRLVTPLIIIGLLSSLGCEETDRKTLLFNGGVGPSLTNDVDPFVRDGIDPFFNDGDPFFHGDQIQRHDLPLFVSRGVQVGPTVIRAQPLINVGCPVSTAFVGPTTAFVAPFNIVIAGNGRSDLFLSDVQTQFVDPFGVRSGAMVIGRPDIVTRFGTTTIPPFGVRTFPFDFPLGCVVPTGTLNIVVFIGNSFGPNIRTVRNITIR